MRRITSPNMALRRAKRLQFAAKGAQMFGETRGIEIGLGADILAQGVQLLIVDLERGREAIERENKTFRAMERKLAICFRYRVQDRHHRIGGWIPVRGATSKGVSLFLQRFEIG